jgi:hypothetical protein
MEKIDLWPEEPTIKDDQVETGFTLEEASGERKRIWYRCSSEQRQSLTGSCDPYILGVLFTAMQKKTNLVVHGQASPSLLRNLEEYQAIWHTWLPQRYQLVEIWAEAEQEPERAAGRGAIMSFSGGLDSAFTAWRHRRGQAGRQEEDLQAGLLIHGFDIPVKSDKPFEHALERARTMLDSLGMEIIPMATNLRKLGGEFLHTHGTILVSCLALMQNRFAVGLIANSRLTNKLVYGWALPCSSISLTDAFLSSNAFTIVHDNASYSRFDKALALANWSEFLRNLRVCIGQHPDRRVHNCCQCVKCIQAILTFRVLGLGLPPGFAQDVSNRQILCMSYREPHEFIYFEEMSELARQRYMRSSWVTALGVSMTINRLLKPVRKSNALRHIRSFER